MKRREFLEWGGLGLASALLVPRLGWAGGSLIEMTARPQNLATPIEYFDREITPNEVFFVRSHFGPPALDKKRKLRVSGMVSMPLELTVDDLGAFEEVTVTAVLQCGGNGRSLQQPRVPGVQWGHGAMGQARFTGVRLADVLRKAGLDDAAAHIRLGGADYPPKPTVPRYLRSIPRERALDPTTLIAYRMNGEPLGLAHGAPLRLVVPGWTGNHWVKWLTELVPQREEMDGFYMQTGYRYPKEAIAPGQAVKPADTVPLSQLVVKSIIANPADGAIRKVGPQEVVGVAFSGAAAIAKVDVSLDGGQRWQPATLEGEGGIGRWQVFRYRYDAATPGPQQVAARATDAAGHMQPEKAQWNGSGYLWNAWHTVRWMVRA